MYRIFTKFSNKMFLFLRPSNLYFLAKDATAQRTMVHKCEKKLFIFIDGILRN